MNLHNTYLVARHEIRTTLAKRSFWFTTFVFPVMILAFTLLPQIMAGQALGGTDAAAVLGVAPDAPRASGYVDRSGLVQRLPEGVTADALRAYADEGAAAAALAGGEIGRYFVVPAEFMDTGELVLVGGQFSPAAVDAGGLMEYVLTANLVGEDRLAGLLIDPTADVDEQGPPVDEARPRPRSEMGFGLSFLVMFLLFFTITLSGGYMLQSVVKEKENRTAEVLLVSLDPQELMAGKVVGLGSLALVQMVIWLGGMAVLGSGAVLLANLGDLTMPPGFVVWALLFFLLGYVVYASALGALGALAPNLREGSQFTFAIILPLLIPLWFNSVFITAPNGPLATAFSLFPLTAPTAMVTRMAATEVPLWQVVVALVGLAITAVVFLRMAARFFRADTLLSEEKLDWRRVVGEVGRFGARTPGP